jgi:hypothetical protein
LPQCPNCPNCKYPNCPIAQMALVLGRGCHGIDFNFITFAFYLFLLFHFLFLLFKSQKNTNNSHKQSSLINFRTLASCLWALPPTKEYICALLSGGVLICSLCMCHKRLVSPDPRGKYKLKEITCKANDWSTATATCNSLQAKLQPVRASKSKKQWN